MTLEEIKASDKTTLTTHDIGTYLGISAERLTAQARKDPGMLGFPVISACDTVRIPRKAFLRWMGEEV